MRKSVALIAAIVFVASLAYLGLHQAAQIVA